MTTFGPQRTLELEQEAGSPRLSRRVGSLSSSVGHLSLLLKEAIV